MLEHQLGVNFFFGSSPLILFGASIYVHYPGRLKYLTIFMVCVKRGRERHLSLKEKKWIHRGCPFSSVFPASTHCRPKVRPILNRRYDSRSMRFQLVGHTTCSYKDAMTQIYRLYFFRSILDDIACQCFLTSVWRKCFVMFSLYASY